MSQGHTRLQPESVRSITHHRHCTSTGRAAPCSRVTAHHRALGEPERDVPAGTAPDSHFPAHPFAPVNMPASPSPGTKKEKGSKRSFNYIFQEKWGSVVTCAGREAQSRVVGPQGAFSSARSSPGQLPAAAHPREGTGTARHPVSHCHPESLPRALNRRCRQLGNSLKPYPACQPVFCRTSQPKCL